ncbi:MAG: TetR/AcrR family transcriptional regulator [Opitutaceae bacterium]|nr:TetR/AcrR family transcriptional regulator [Opitutaceae bacterium]
MSRAKPDRRIARTQQSLHRSLNTLILEKGYEATTIKDIVSNANVGRSTFYAHHGSKEGLLLSGLEHLRAALLAQRSGASAAPRGQDMPMLGFSRTFFEHVHEYRDVLQALLQNEGGPIVTRKIKRLLADVVRHDLRRAKPEGRTDEVPREALIQFTVDTFFSILLWWFERSPKLSPVEVDAIFRRLALPALAAAGAA